MPIQHNRQYYILRLLCRFAIPLLLRGGKHCNSFPVSNMNSVEERKVTASSLEYLYKMHLLYRPQTGVNVKTYLEIRYLNKYGRSIWHGMESDYLFGCDSATLDSIKFGALID
jgi:hypothetical protein